MIETILLSVGQYENPPNNKQISAKAKEIRCPL